MAVCSIAIAAGVLGVAMVIKGLLFRRHFRGGGPWAHAACGPSFGPAWRGGGSCGEGRGHGPPWARRRGWGGWGGGPGGSFWLRRLFARIDTTPGQEREIRSALEELQNRARDAKDGVKGARGDLAKAFRGAELDDAAIGDAGARADAAAAQVKDAFTAALRRIHAVLDDKQRERLADLLANGPGFGRSGGPYRESI